MFFLMLALFVLQYIIKSLLSRIGSSPPEMGEFSLNFQHSEIRELVSASDGNPVFQSWRLHCVGGMRGPGGRRKTVTMTILKWGVSSPALSRSWFFFLRKNISVAHRDCFSTLFFSFCKNVDFRLNSFWKRTVAKKCWGVDVVNAEGFGFGSQHFWVGLRKCKKWAGWAGAWG